MKTWILSSALALLLFAPIGIAHSQSLDPEAMRAAAAVVELRRQMAGPDLGTAQLTVVLERVRQLALALATTPYRNEVVSGLEVERERLVVMWERTTERSAQRPDIATRLPEFQQRFEALFAHIESLPSASVAERRGTANEILSLIGRRHLMVTTARQDAPDPTLSRPFPVSEEEPAE